MLKVTVAKEDKQIQVVNVAPSKSRRKQFIRFAIYVAVALVVTVLVVLGSLKLDRALKDRRSKKLINTVSYVEKNKECADGLKQISPLAPQLSSSSHYSDAAREAALKYLMNCNFLIGNPKASLGYAGQLNDLYDQEGNIKKQKELSQIMLYFKEYGK